MSAAQLLKLVGCKSQQHVSEPAELPEECWGFSATPSLRCQLIGAAQQTISSQPANLDSKVSILTQLESGSAFLSNHCVHAMAMAYGISSFTDSLSGTLIAGQRADLMSAEVALQAIKQQVDGEWSREGVRRGVRYAKSGQYQQAMDCYHKALDLDPANCDAYVARGAAHANNKQFDAALSDFKAALQLDPNNANAAKYLKATQLHLAAAGAALATTEPGAAGKQQGRTGHSGRAKEHTAVVDGGRQPSAGVNAVQRTQQGAMQHAVRSGQGLPYWPNPDTIQTQRQEQQQHSSQSPALQRQHGSHPHSEPDNQLQRRQRHDSPSPYHAAGVGRRSSHSRSHRHNSYGGISNPETCSYGDTGGDGEAQYMQSHSRPSIEDIREAIEVLRSAATNKEKDKSSSKSKKKRRHSTGGKHKQHHKHKRRKHH